MKNDELYKTIVERDDDTIIEIDIVGFDDKLKEIELEQVGRTSLENILQIATGSNPPYVADVESIEKLRDSYEKCGMEINKLRDEIIYETIGKTATRYLKLNMKEIYIEWSSKKIII